MTTIELKLECAKILYPICSKLSLEGDTVLEKIEKLYQYVVLPVSERKEHSKGTPTSQKRST